MTVCDRGEGRGLAGAYVRTGENYQNGTMRHLALSVPINQ